MHQNATIQTQDVRMFVEDAPTVGTALASPLWLILSALGVLYGSLLPLSFDVSRLGWSNAFGLASINLCGGTPEDVMTNLVVYVPIGLATVLFLQNRGVSCARQVGTALIIGLGLSVAAESIQTTMPIRVASWLDVALNTAGAAAGAIMACTLQGPGKRVMSTWGQRLVRSPLAFATTAITLSLLVVELVPFDFATSTAALHRSFHNADWSWPRWQAAIAPGTLTVASTSLVMAAWFATWGYMSGLTAHVEGQSRSTTVALTALRGSALVVVIECLQLFAVSPTFELSSIVIRSSAVTLGATASYLVRGDSAPIAGQTLRRAIPTGALAAIVLLVVVRITASAMDARLAGKTTYTQWLPFHELWLAPMPHAGLEIARTLLAYCLLVGALAIVLRRARLQHAWWIAGVSAVFVAMLRAMICRATSADVPDLTSPLLAGLATLMVIHTYLPLRNWLVRARV